MTPEGDWPFANVLADGPSVLETREEDLLPGPVVAINCSLRMSSFLPIDVWASVDAPSHLWDAVNGHLGEDVDILSTGNNVQAWADRVDVGRLLIVEPTYLEEEGTFLRDERGRKLMMPTIIYVLGYLRKYRNSSHVRIFGADMQGTNGPLHPFLPFEYANDEAATMRWDMERKILARATRLYREEGRRVERYFVEPENR